MAGVALASTSWRVDVRFAGVVALGGVLRIAVVVAEAGDGPGAKGEAVGAVIVARASLGKRRAVGLSFSACAVSLAAKLLTDRHAWPMS